MVLLGLLFPASAGARPVLLLFHPGGFTEGSPHQEDAAAAFARTQGFQPVEVDYPLWNIAHALKYSMNEARSWKGRKVFAYGDSAGGTLAERIAEQGLAGRAAVQAPVTDVPSYVVPIEHFLQVDWTRQARWLSPNLHRSSRPIRVYIPRQDPLSVPTRAWVKADPLVTGQPIPGDHLQQPYASEAMHSAISYLANP